MEPGPGFIEFYVSLVTYTVMHMIFVISSDFVEAFNIPPLNIGIYVDKLAAIRALLMVIADIVEWQILDKALEGSMGGKMSKSLVSESNNPRRIGSIVSFIGMFACRLTYLIIVYKSDNKSLSVFITLCIEGFLFGVFQMSFFAIGPEYNALTSLGIHTMGNFIFFLQLILQRRAKSKPKINSLYRVRVHGWVCLATSLIALCLWLYFCVKVDAQGDDTPSEWPEYNDVWSPFWLFIIGAFAEDFSVPGILPFAFLDPEKANLVNYLTPLFFMSGALVIVFSNDFFTGGKGLAKTLKLPDLGFKDWSSSTAPDVKLGQYWHAFWLLNIPKYLAFFIAMFSIHGTFDDLRCIIQSRWRVMLLTLNVVVPRATLEVAGYVGVANYAIGRSDFGLVEAELIRAISHGLKEGKVTEFPVAASTLKSAIDNENNNVKEALAGWINFKYWSGINSSNITASDTSGTPEKVTVEISESGGSTSAAPTGDSTANVVKSGNNGVKVTITGIGGKDDAEKKAKATGIANKIASFVAMAALTNQLKDGGISSKDKLNATEIQTKLGTAKDHVAKLVQGYNGADVNNASDSGINATNESGTVKVTFGMSEKFKELVTQLKEKVGTHLTGSPTSDGQIATNLEGLLNQVKDNQLKNLAQSMVVGTKVSKVENVSVSKNASTMTVKIQPKGTGSTLIGESTTVTVAYSTYTATVEIKVMGQDPSGGGDLTKDEGTAIANVVALAIVHEDVKNAAQSVSYTIKLKEPDKVGSETVNGNPVPVNAPSENFQIQVNLHKSLAKNGDPASFVATDLAKLVRGAAVAAAIGKGRAGAYTDFGAFAYIAYHDILAMFCRFVYGKFAVGYNTSLV